MRFGSLEPAVFNRAWNWGVLATCFCMIYSSICIDTPRIKFLSALGFSAFHFGIIAGLSSLSLIFQVAAGVAVRYLEWRKTFWFTTVLTQRLSYTFVIAAPFLFGEGTGACIWFIILILFLHDASGNLSGPPWLSWMADIVPRDSMNTIWGRRLRWLTLAQITGTLAAAFTMQYFESRNDVIFGYVCLGTLGIAAGVTDVVLFRAKVPENYHAPDRSTGMWQALTAPLRDRSYRPVLFFMTWWYFALMVAAPFFVVYLIRSMQMPILWVQLTTVSALVGLAFGGPVFGLLADTFGTRSVLQTCIVMKNISLLPYVFLPNRPELYWLFPALLWFDGMLNAGFALGIQNTMFAYCPPKSRTMYIGVTQFLSLGLGGGIAPTLSGLFIDRFEPTGFDIPGFSKPMNVYHFVFWLSLFLRLPCLFLASALPSVNNMSTLSIVKQWFSRDTCRMIGGMMRLSFARSAATRVRACEYLGRVGNPMAVGVLLSQLDQRDYAVRHAAVIALGNIGSEKATATLAQAMFDPDSGISQPATEALGRIGGHDSLRYLLKNLKRQNRNTLLTTIESLGNIGDTAAILPLVCMMDSAAHDPQLRQTIARALKKLGQASNEQEVLALFAPQQQQRM